MQLGFVIDHSRCIGCHACTVACKAENDVPLGKFRTWVKYTEAGRFPEVRRSFAVLRCNQCTHAPCVKICPVKALSKRADGIVDIDPAACIGCKACLQGCPYDALYIDDDSGTAAKCHFCAHRTEVGLAPACAIVCPTEAIIPGDFHDPTSVVSRLRAGGTLAARKVEAGTGPNVFYREAGPAGIDPALTAVSGGYLWSNRQPGMPFEAERFDAARAQADAASAGLARTTYDVDHLPAWGGRVSSYLFTKSLAAGLFLVAALLAGLAPSASVTALVGGALAMLLVTTVLLVADLKRPARFLYIVLRPNFDSWLARGAIVLGAYGAILTAVLAAELGGIAMPRAVLAALFVAGAVFACLTAAYTGWLFAQAKGRVLWMRRGLWLHLIFQASAAGGAAALVGSFALGLTDAEHSAVRALCVASLVVHGVFALTEHRFAPARRAAEFARAARLVTHGPWARRHWAFGMALGIAIPLALLVPVAPVLHALAGALALAGLFVEEDVLVRAGQALAIS